MPAVSDKQRRLMQAVAHGWRKPGGGGPPEAVAKEYVREDGMAVQRAVAARLRGEKGKRAR